MRVLTRRWIRIVLTLAVSAPIAAAAVAGPGTALAVSCISHSSGNYYAVAEWDSSPSNQGNYADIYVSSGSASDWQSPGNGFIDQTLWENTYNSKYGVYWVEAGYGYGWEGSNLFTYYWADQRPNGGGYHEHRVSSITPSVGTWMPIEIKEVNGGSSWNVYFNWTIQTNHDGTQTISTNNPGYSEGMATGLESTSNASSMSSSASSGMDYWDPSTGWNGGWGSGSNDKVWCDAGWVYWVSGQQDHEINDGM